MSTESFRTANNTTIEWLEREASAFDQMTLLFSDLRTVLSSDPTPWDALRAEADRARNQLAAEFAIEGDSCPNVWRRSQQGRLRWCDGLVRRLERARSVGDCPKAEAVALLARIDQAEAGISAALAASREAVLTA